MKPVPFTKKKGHPCHYLNDIRFAANGEIWLCGCVISELPNHQELKVGHQSEAKDLSKVKEKQKEIQGQWRQGKNIPYTCRECTWYVAK